jgi:hypothetical protein
LAQKRPAHSGFRAAGARFVEALARCPASRFAPLLPDRLAARKTELLPTRCEPLKRRRFAPLLTGRSTCIFSDIES